MHIVRQSWTSQSRCEQTNEDFETLVAAGSHRRVLIGCPPAATNSLKLPLAMIRPSLGPVGFSVCNLATQLLLMAHAQFLPASASSTCRYLIVRPQRLPLSRTSLFLRGPPAARVFCLRGLDTLLCAALGCIDDHTCNCPRPRSGINANPPEVVYMPGLGCCVCS